MVPAPSPTVSPGCAGRTHRPAPACATLLHVDGSNDRARRALASAPWLAYPLAVWASLSVAGPRVAASLVLVALAVRTWPLWRRATAATRRQLLVPLVAAGAPAVGSAWLDDPLLLLFVPALVSLGLLFAFARSLWWSPSLVETLARLQVGELSDAEVRYCRGVTALWCTFFAANALAAALLAWTASLRAWALWTGVYSYLAIAVLFTLELTVRSWRFRRYTGGPSDWVMRRLFPPDS